MAPKDRRDKRRVDPVDRDSDKDSVRRGPLHRLLDKFEIFLDKLESFHRHSGTNDEQGRERFDYHPFNHKFRKAFDEIVDFSCSDEFDVEGLVRLMKYGLRAIHYFDRVCTFIGNYGKYLAIVFVLLLLVFVLLLLVALYIKW